VARVLVNKSSLKHQIDEHNAQLAEADPKVRGKLLDAERPDIWPSQHSISSVLHRIKANGLEKWLGNTDPSIAGWFASMRLPGAGSFLRAIPSLHMYKVSSECFRVQLTMRIMAKIPALDHPGKRCICGYSGPMLATGVHYLTQCPSISLSTTRHNQVVRSIGKMINSVGWDARTGENAAWFRRRPDLRPFDILYKIEPTDKWKGIDIGIGDPTRFGLAPTGQRYMKSGQAAVNVIQRKNDEYRKNLSRYGPLRVPVDYMPIGFEATGGAGVKAAELIRSIYAAAEEAKAKVPNGQWTWSAQTFAAHWQQRLSFEMSKFAAMSVLIGARKIASAEAAVQL
jgi:hypothetical protein